MSEYNAEPVLSDASEDSWTLLDEVDHDIDLAVVASEEENHAAATSASRPSESSDDRNNVEALNTSAAESDNGSFDLEWVEIMSINFPVPDAVQCFHMHGISRKVRLCKMQIPWVWLNYVCHKWVNVL